MKTLLEQEILVGRGFNSALLLLAATGCTTYFFLSHGALQQVITLFHVCIGLVLALLFIPYTFMHFRRTIGFRRPVVLFSGVLLSMLLGVAIATGLAMLLQGQRENQAWLLEVHVATWIGIAGLVLLHILGHLVFFPAKRKQSNNPRLPSLNRFDRYVFLFTGIVVLGAGGVFSLNQHLYTPNSGQPHTGSYDYLYGLHPFRPSQTETVDNQFIEEPRIANSLMCRECHSDIGQQWASSAHARAASDIAYDASINLLVKQEGISAARYCDGCHTPVALLSGALTTGGVHGGMQNTIPDQEGVNCISCHRITRLVHTKGVASYEFGLPQPYLFDLADNPILQSINRLSIRLNPDQHKQDMRADILSESAYCSSCHAQFIDATVNKWGWVQLQDEYKAWLTSPYSGHQDPLFASEDPARCQDCHMPLVSADDPSANIDGKVRNHRFLAANTMLPLLAGDNEQLELTKQFLQTNKLTVSIDKPYREDATRNDMALEESLRQQAVQPYYFYKGEQAEVRVIVSNNGVGHSFPGGTIDLNEAWVSLQVVDAEGNEVFSSGLIEPGEALGNDAYTYRTIAVNREGNLLWQHDLFNMIGEVSRNVIRSGESDVVPFKFQVPYWAKSPLTATAVLHYRKLNTRFARWALGDQYQPLPIVDMARGFLAIPLRDQPETYTATPEPSLQPVNRTY